MLRRLHALITLLSGCSFPALAHAQAPADTVYMVTLRDTSTVVVDGFEDRARLWRGRGGRVLSRVAWLAVVRGIPRDTLATWPEVRQDTFRTGIRVDSIRVAIEADGFTGGTEEAWSLPAAWAAPWHIDAMGFRKVHALDLTGAGQVVATLDGGVDTLHSELRGKIAFCVAYAGPSPAACTDDLPAGGGHGTHIGASVVGRTMGGAPGARLHNLKVYEMNGSQIGARASVQASALLSLTWPGAPRIAFLSMGAATQYANVCSAAARFVAGGGVLLVSSGNGGGALWYPGACPGVVPVGSVDASMTRAASSNYPPALVCPGVGILSALPGGGYGEKSGTSMSTPVCVAAVAIVQEERTRQGKPLLNQTQMVAILCSYTVRTTPAEQTGCGMPDLPRIIASMRGGCAISGDTIRTYTVATVDSITAICTDGRSTLVSDNPCVTIAPGYPKQAVAITPGPGCPAEARLRIGAP